MKKLAGLTIFLLILYVSLMVSNKNAWTAQYHGILGERIGIKGIISLGAGILIITGGIDLSIGSVMVLCATVTVIALQQWQLPPAVVIPGVIALGALVGLGNGLLVTLLKLQPFVVTLCGLFVYRGLARWLSHDSNLGLQTDYPELREWIAGFHHGIPSTLVIFLVLLAIAGVFLHLTVYGRYLYALGSNEKAARYSGILTRRYQILAYVLCSALAGLCGMVSLMDDNQVTPSSAYSFFELYAIAGAVLGGFSLRGGEGHVAGIILGTAILVLLPSLTVFWGIPADLEPTVIGTALLIGAVIDETLRRRSATRTR